MTVRTADFDYHLPAELIAQHPAVEREGSRLLVVDRASQHLEHHRFSDLPLYLRDGDVVVLNNSRVIPARIRGRNARTGGSFEILLLEENSTNDWWVMLRPGKRARAGTQIILIEHDGTATGVRATVTAVNVEGHRRLVFYGVADVRSVLDRIGEVPLPPYIERASGASSEEDRERYQTVYAQQAGSVAAPTAGLHFTRALLDDLRAHGVQICFVTLHVGLGTFAPVKSETLAGHVMHEEKYELSEECAAIINRAKAERRRVLAVGTTTVRVLESAATAQANPGSSLVRPGTARTRIFIYPPYDFQIIDGLLTNFHLPRSTLLMLVSAFAAPGQIGGRELLLKAYAEAIAQRYRFYSYGDAMLLL